MISLEQYNVTKQSIQNKHIKIQLLNANLTPFYGAELSGSCTDGNVNVDSTADLRRTCSLVFTVDDKSFDIGEFKYIWLGRYISLSVGIESLSTGEIVWFPQGIYIIDAPSIDYSADSYTLRFSGLDMMSNLTGMRNGYLEGIPTIIPQGSSVRDAMIAILKLGGITKVNISDCKTLSGKIQTVPNDITIDQGGTIYDVLVQLRDILPYYEFFFDIDGTFVFQQIPTGEDEQIIANDDLFKQVLLSESIDTDFQAVKNVIEVYGQTITPSYYATNVIVTPNIATNWCRIDLTVPEYNFNTSDTYTYIGFELPSNIAQKVKLRINGISGSNLSLRWQDRETHSTDTISSLSKGVYMINYNKDESNTSIWELSEYGQVSAIVKDTNPKSPFYIGKEAGEIRQPLFGGEYDNITTNPLARERAKWELYKRTRLQDNVSLNIVPVYYFEANQLISHAVKGTTKEELYLIKSYSIDLKTEGTMNISAIRYYAEYPNI